MSDDVCQWNRKEFKDAYSPCRCCGGRDVFKTAAISSKPGFVWIVVECTFCENRRGGYYRKVKGATKDSEVKETMTNNEAKMAEEICSLRAALRGVTDFLDSVLDSGLPGKGRGQNEKESIEIWWEDRVSAIKRARQALEATSEYGGAIIR